MTYIGDSNTPKRNLKANNPPKLVTAAVNSEQEPKPSIMNGITRAAENRLATVNKVNRLAVRGWEGTYG